jgi:hypothetical protein
MKPILSRLGAAVTGALLLAGLLLGIGHAQVPTQRAVLDTVIDVDARAWQTSVISAGGTVSPQQLVRVSTLIRGLKVDHVWEVHDRLWLFAAENSTQARRDLVARARSRHRPTARPSRRIAATPATGCRATSISVSFHPARADTTP